MKKSQLRQIIKEEIKTALQEPVEEVNGDKRTMGDVVRERITSMGPEELKVFASDLLDWSSDARQKPHDIWNFLPRYYDYDLHED